MGDTDADGTDPSAGAETSETAGLIGPSSIRVLIVDDEEDALREMSRALRSRGHQVFGACNLKEATLQAHTNSVDVAVVDWALKRETGEDVCLMLKTLRPPPMVIVIAGKGGVDRRKRSYRAGAAAHLLKPVDPEELDLLMRRLHESRTEGSIPRPGRSPFDIAEELGQVRVNGALLHRLSHAQRALIRYLSWNVDRIVSLEELRKHLELASIHSTQELLSETRKNIGEHRALVETIRAEGVLVRSKSQS